MWRCAGRRVAGRSIKFWAVREKSPLDKAPPLRHATHVLGGAAAETVHVQSAPVTVYGYDDKALAGALMTNQDAASDLAQENYMAASTDPYTVSERLSAEETAATAQAP